MENTSSSQPPLSVNNNLSLPPIKQLFSESYRVFTKSLLSLIVLSLISLLITGLILIFAGLLLLPLGVYQEISKLMSSAAFDPSILNNLLFSGGIVFALTFLLLMILGYVFQVAPILTVAECETRPSVRSVIKRSFKYIFPLILLNLITFFLIFGSFFILVIPAVIIGFFLMFALYEVVLSNQKPPQAIRNSVSLVSQHFGGIIIRIFIYLFGYTFFIIFIPNLIRKIAPETGAIIGFYVSLVSFFIGWFGLAFYITLYKQVKNVHDATRKTRLIWIVVLAVFGWIIGGLMIFYGFKML